MPFTHIAKEGRKSRKNLCDELIYNYEYTILLSVELTGSFGVVNSFLFPLCFH